MKLVHPDFEFSIDFSDGSMTALFFDSPPLMRRFLQSFLNQYENDDGSFVLSENGSEISLQNNVSLITDPICFEINDKRLATKVQNQLKSFIVSEDMYEATNEVLANINRYSERVKEAFTYPITNSEAEATGLIKLLNFSLAYDYENELEKLLEYMNMMHDICKVSAFMILNLFSYFSIDEVRTFCNEARLHGHSVLLVDSNLSVSEQSLEFLRKIIIDVDGCQLF